MQINSHTRQETIDILRGVALVLILIVHCAFDFTGWGWTVLGDEQALLPLATLDKPIGELLNLFLRDKARAMFAMMFGVAFALQLARSQQSGESFERMFIKRMAMLAVIGVIHGHLIYSFEILRLYAIAGLLMLLLWRLPNRSLLATAGFLAVLGPILFYGIGMALGLDFFGGRVSLEDMYAGYTSSSVRELLALTHRLAMGRYTPADLIFMGMPILGCFLLGLWLARCGWLMDPTAHRPVLRRLMVRGLVPGLLLQLGASILWRLMDDSSPAWHGPVLGLAHFAAAPLLALGYISAIALLCTHPGWHRKLVWLAPAGRMTLTNYIMQSLFAWMIFYGVGLALYGQIGPAIAVPIALLLALFQILLSAWWLQRYYSGPLEWLWRWAIKGQRPRWQLPPIGQPRLEKQGGH